MKILFLVNDLSFGGAERHLVTLASGLVQRGHDILVASLKGGPLQPAAQSRAMSGVTVSDPPHPRHAAEPQPQPQPGPETTRAAPAPTALDQAPVASALADGGIHQQLGLQSRGGLDLAALKRLASLLDSAMPDILVATSQYALMYAALARLRSRHHPAMVYICHSMGVLRHNRAERLRFAVYRWFYRMADCVVFVSGMQHSFVRALGVKPRRAEVVHNGVNLSQFDPAALSAQAERLRHQHGLHASDLVVGLCAVLREEKRPLDLLDALARLRQSGVAARAIFIGDGPLRPQLQARIAALGLERAVILAGYQADVRPWLAACDVVALTSATEAFPMSTLEAMALGRPLVASAVGGLPEQITDGDNGLLYPAGDIPRLAAALQRLCDPAVRATMGVRAQTVVRQRFDVQAMTDRYQAIFNSLLPTGVALTPGAMPLTDRAP